MKRMTIQSRYTSGKKFYKDQFIEILEFMNKLGLEGRRVTSMTVENVVPIRIIFEHEPEQTVEIEDV